MNLASSHGSSPSQTPLVTIDQIRAQLVSGLPRSLAGFVNQLSHLHGSAIVFQRDDTPWEHTWGFVYRPLVAEAGGFRPTTAGQLIKLEIAGELKDTFREAFVEAEQHTKYVQRSDGSYGMLIPQLRSLGQVVYEMDELLVPVEIEADMVSFLMSQNQDADTLLLVEQQMAYRFEPNSDNGTGIAAEFLNVLFGPELVDQDSQRLRKLDKTRSFNDMISDLRPCEVPNSLQPLFERAFPPGHGSIDLTGFWDGENRPLGKLIRTFR